MDSIFSGIQSARQHVQDAKSKLSAAIAAYTADLANNTGGHQGSDVGNGDYGGYQGVTIANSGVTQIANDNQNAYENAAYGNGDNSNSNQGDIASNNFVTESAYNNQDAYENAAYGNGDNSNSNSNQNTLTTNNFVTDSANNNQDAYENAAYGGNNGIAGTQGTNAGTSLDVIGNDTDNDAGNGAYSGPQGGELYPSNPEVVGESYSGEQGGTPGSVPDNATGGPNSLSTGHTTNPESVVGLDSNTMNGLNNTDSNDAGTMTTDEHTVNAGVDLGVVSGSVGQTTGSAEQVTHNADGTSSVISQDNINTGVTGGVGVVVANIESGSAHTNIHSVENSGPTEQLQDSINDNGGLLDTSDISAIPEGITVTEIGEPGFGLFDGGDTDTASLSTGVSVGVELPGDIGAEFSSESTATVSTTNVGGLDTTIATNNGDTTTVATGETSITETTHSVQNSDGVSVGDSGPVSSDTFAATNTSQHTVTEGMDYPNTADGQNAAQTHADTGDLTLDESGQYDVTTQTTNTHTETMTQGGISVNTPGSTISGGAPEVLNSEVEQMTTVEHMQGDPNSGTNHWPEMFGGDQVLGTSTSHSMTESPQNGEDGFAVTQTSDFQGQGTPNIEEVQVDTTGGLSYDMTPAEMQEHAQTALHFDPDNQVLQDIANGESAPEAISNSGNPLTDTFVGNDNAPTNAALESIATLGDPQAMYEAQSGVADANWGGSTTDTNSDSSGDGAGTGSTVNTSVAESANNNQDSYENEAYGSSDTGSDSDSDSDSSTNSGSTTSSSVTESANSNQDSYENEAYGNTDSSSDSNSSTDSDSDSSTDSGTTTSGSVTESANDNQDSYENAAYGNTDTTTTTTSDSDSDDDDDDDDDGGCFLTTSACEHRGLSDDCHELTVLRGFRDTWMHATPELQEQVQEYYRVAPAVVESIQAMPDRTVILESMFTEYIRPSVEAIERGENDMAYDIYVKMLSNVQKLTAANMSSTAISIEA